MITITVNKNLLILQIRIVLCIYEHCSELCFFEGIDILKFFTVFTDDNLLTANFLILNFYNIIF